MSKNDAILTNTGLVFGMFFLTGVIFQSVGFVFGVVDAKMADHNKIVEYVKTQMNKGGAE